MPVGVSEFFAADVVVSAVVVLVFLLFERRHVRASWWIPVLALVTFGVSVALPLLLYLREVPRSKVSEIDASLWPPEPRNG